MPTPKKKRTWSQIRRHVKDWPPESLLGLVKDLYDASKANKDFLHARFLAQTDGEGALEPFRKIVVDQFYPQRGFGKLKLGQARKAIRDYRKATGDPVGTVDLMLTFLENGTAFTLDFGDIDEPFYDSLAAVCDEMAATLSKQCPKQYPRFRERLHKLAEDANGIGWGYGDIVQERVDILERKLGDK